MKLDLTTLSLLAGAIPAVSAHYVFSKLIVDGKATQDFEYIRRNSNGYMPTLAENITTNDFRCNTGSMDAAPSTKIMKVAPGQKIGFQLAYGATMKHPGPLQIYMSKADGDIKSYDGSGDWFKVYQMSLCQDTSDGIKDTDWCTWDQNTVTFTLAENTPPGQYLIRPEHIGLHRGFSGNSEFYFTCAQVEVTGSGTGTPGPTVKFPGVYSPDDANVHFNIYYPTPTTYELPGPAVWSGNGSTPATSVPVVSSKAPAATSAAPISAVEEASTVTPVPASSSTPSE
ncbi:glycosyl hydrolase family 61-domain-containing protein [Clohesyomyces aquaticus]|uniref:AA9 family lytic polysaccharide monooxygenase n=1 Tax=Clohesyomyces aquaticus TaxID=1231657 RepID=A0A1Y1YLP8_9PLEO|nr:glycosyl hydrolase family 61-domain-containing protein [Clohesyomyces aquaticus]